MMDGQFSTKSWVRINSGIAPGPTRPRSTLVLRESEAFCYGARGRKYQTDMHCILSGDMINWRHFAAFRYPILDERIGLANRRV